MSLTAIGVGMAALAVIGGGLGIGFATSSAVKAIAQQPEAHGKIRHYSEIGIVPTIPKLKLCRNFLSNIEDIEAFA